MYSVNEIVSGFVKHWHNCLGSYNQPQKYILKQHLQAPKKIIPEVLATYLHDTLDELTTNSMRAISGIEGFPEEMLKEFKTENIGIINYYTYSKRKETKLIIEDNGCGINLLEDDSEGLSLDKVFQLGYTTKNSSGFGTGMYTSKKNLNNFNSSISVVGTTYLNNDSLITLGNHHGLHTGTIIEITFPKNIKPKRYSTC